MNTFRIILPFFTTTSQFKLLNLSGSCSIDFFIEHISVFGSFFSICFYFDFWFVHKSFSFFFELLIQTYRELKQAHQSFYGHFVFSLFFEENFFIFQKIVYQIVHYSDFAYPTFYWNEFLKVKVALEMVVHKCEAVLRKHLR